MAGLKNAACNIFFDGIVNRMVEERPEWVVGPVDVTVSTLNIIVERGNVLIDALTREKEAVLNDKGGQWQDVR